MTEETKHNLYIVLIVAIVAVVAVVALTLESMSASRNSDIFSTNSVNSDSSGQAYVRCSSGTLQPGNPCNICNSAGTGYQAKCTTSQTCNNGQCITKKCIPQTCASLGKQCGNWSNGCGTTIMCPSCVAGTTCNNGQCINKCIDSDGGMKIYIAGTASNGITKASDECTKQVWNGAGYQYNPVPICSGYGCYVDEAVCLTGAQAGLVGKGGSGQPDHLCPYGCSNNACIRP